MSRLLQVIIALVGLAITAVLGLASERSESLQARHTLIGLFTETISTARSSCDADLADMAQFALEQLAGLESSKRLLLTAEDRADRDNTQALIAKYQDIMAGVKGTIESGACGTASVASAPAYQAEAYAPQSSASGGAAPPPPAPPVLSQAPATANMDLRRAERVGLPQVVAEAARARVSVGDNEAAEATSAGGYYAVLASYGIDEPITYTSRGVVADYRRLSQAAGAEGLQVKVFQTHESDHYAIVLVPDGQSRAGARELVAAARARGWSRDAFVQLNRGWVECANPEQITASNRCIR